MKAASFSCECDYKRSSLHDGVGLRRARFEKGPMTMMVHRYTGIIESILTSSITIWYAATTTNDKGRLQVSFALLRRSSAIPSGPIRLHYPGRPLQTQTHIFETTPRRRLQSIRTSLAGNHKLLRYNTCL